MTFKKNLVSIALAASMATSVFAGDQSIKANLSKDYDRHLDNLYKFFHANPELSGQEYNTSKRLAKELRLVGYTVTESVGGTGIVGILKNGSGPVVMVRADMDGLPVQEKTGLDYASKVFQLDEEQNKKVPVMHACSHDSHMTGLVATARYMASNKDKWSGTLMMIGQPAEERVMGAKQMLADGLWKKFGKPDYALAFHTMAGKASGEVYINNAESMAGADTVDIIITGVGAHGASPHASKDPVVLGSQIVLALQTVVSREISPREPGVITVGAFNSGTKHNIISDRATLKLTVRSTNQKTRKKLLDGIKRIAENMGRVAGLPEDKLPQVIVLKKESVPPLVNTTPLAKRLASLWAKKMPKVFKGQLEMQHMGSEDFGDFSENTSIKSAYFFIGGTIKADYDAFIQGKHALAFNHSPQFKIDPKPAITSGSEASIHALLDLLKKK